MAENCKSGLFYTLLFSPFQSLALATKLVYVFSHKIWYIYCLPEKLATLVEGGTAGGGKGEKRHPLLFFFPSHSHLPALPCPRTFISPHKRAELIKLVLAVVVVGREGRRKIYGESPCLPKIVANSFHWSVGGRSLGGTQLIRKTSS